MRQETMELACRMLSLTEEEKRKNSGGVSAEAAINGKNSSPLPFYVLSLLPSSYLPHTEIYILIRSRTRFMASLSLLFMLASKCENISGLYYILSPSGFSSLNFCLSSCSQKIQLASEQCGIQSLQVCGKARREHFSCEER